MQLESSGLTVIYLRQSKDRKHDEAAVDRQLKDCRKRAAERYPDVEPLIFSDNDKSATDRRKKRPDFEKLLKFVQEGRVKHIYAWNMDRLTRNSWDKYRFLSEAEKHSLIITLIIGPELDMSTPFGRYMASQMADQAKLEVDIKSERQKNQELQAAERGLVPRVRAFGYNRDGSVNAQEAGAVLESFDALIAGASLRTITKTLNDGGFATNTGKPWHRSGVRFMLKNPRYAGIRTRFGEEVSQGQWKAIVSEEQLRAAQEILADPGRQRLSSDGGRRWLGGGLYVCGKCLVEHEKYYSMGTYYQNSGIRQYRCNNCYMRRSATSIDEYVQGKIVYELRTNGPVPSRKKLTDTAALRTESMSLRARLQALAKNLDLDEVTLAIRSRAIKDRLSAIEAKVAEGVRGTAMEALKGAKDYGQKWLEIPDMRVRQDIVRLMCTVVLLPGIPSAAKKPFDTSTVRFDDSRV